MAKNNCGQRWKHTISINKRRIFCDVIKRWNRLTFRFYLVLVRFCSCSLLHVHIHMFVRLHIPGLVWPDGALYADILTFWKFDWKNLAIVEYFALNILHPGVEVQILSMLFYRLLFYLITVPMKTRVCDSIHEYWFVIYTTLIQIISGQCIVRW